MSKYKVAYYIRVIMGEQSEGYSLEGQKSTLDDWVKDMEWRWVKTYYDEAIVKDTNREKFQELITDAKHGLFDGICMVDSDRFSRSTKDLLDIMDDLIEHRVRLHIHNLQHIDIYNEQGRFLLTNLAAYSEFFRGQLASKIRAGVKQKMKNEWFGQAPYGYTIISDDIGGRRKNTRLKKDREEQKVLTKMRKLRENGKSYSEIATALNKDGIPTRYTKENKKK
ncbi:site-specific recombinase, DNA invertase Pin [Thermoplasmatales archaeon SCGC AB-539-C06]|nr:site-specific recombinase, DNA invertase Pin [Thermoplasmatales archaeon SCGC AB-539-C06]